MFKELSRSPQHRYGVWLVEGDEISEVVVRLQVLGEGRGEWSQWS